MHQCTGILFHSHNQCYVRFQQFFNDRMISSHIRRSNTSSSQIETFQKLQGTYVLWNFMKQQLCYFVFVKLPIQKKKKEKSLNSNNHLGDTKRVLINN